ncbi:leucine-tRNA ligase [Sphaceloma murrayae]|uniref:leucine--tRNA ligase n=1 Tax=Sphaceloma murrayae TaxID=2082308 RepID=A0A2K1QKM4_9PEZI|nr:leucine-tRNA ligase [Sphaceloma murrayae]
MAAVQATKDALDPSNSSKNTLKIENTDKRDTLIASEKKYQAEWQKAKVFEQDAPSLSEVPYHQVSADELRKKHPKYMATMAYPYMNGVLHAGHSFTASKVEFGTGWARMRGKRALFPQGYHCTGMPIKACADKLVDEVKRFGQNFENCPADDVVTGDVATPAPTQETTKADVTKFTAKKSKAAAKAVKLNYQFQIMLALGLPVEEIHKFADPQHWLQYFPPLCQRDLTGFGARVDWRRSMVTTDANLYYDAFVRWQMNRLKELGKIKFGKRYTVYSPKDGQACMDHDRQTGEGIGVQEYTAIKLRVKEWPELASKKLEGKLPAGANVYFVPATLRPETMYGQTCCFVGPKLEYGIYHVSDNEYYLISHRAARNMAYQGIFPKWGEFPKVADVLGSDVVGALVNAPLSVHKDGIRILPMESVKASKGTGVVTCVPSDSPDDYATIMDLTKKAEYYGIKKEWADVEITPLIETPSYGNLTAKFLVEKMKINSPKDAKQLAEAKDLAYKEGFYKGTMVYGDFKGKSVEEAKPLVRQQMIDSGDAFNYAEPDGVVISRSADECVAGHLDQWYLNYGKADPKWQGTVLDYITNPGLNTFSGEAKNAFEQTIDWLGQWACARSYGLGSKLPWDPQFLVESLSDSTIYMSYYTIAHLLHNDVFGKTRGSADVGPEQMTDEVWDYVFCRTDKVPSGIPEATLQTMRREFEYWYPLDVRVSGKDLIQNHLTFFLYVHLAIFPKEYWPQAIRVNGHLMLNGEKMSKSTGNFLTLHDATGKFGADATRIALADAGDGVEDANFEESVANASILKLFELRKWCEEMVNDARLVKDAAEYRQVRDGEKVKYMDAVQRTGEMVFWDKVFENDLNALVKETEGHYEETSYKSALKTGFYDFTTARDSYRNATISAGIGMHATLVKRYIELQALMLTVIAPHWSEYIWLELLKKPDTIQNALFPTVPATDAALTAARDYVRNTSTSITQAEGQQVKRMQKGKATSYDPKKDKRLRIFMARKYPAWQEKYIDIVREMFDKVKLSIDMKEVSKKIDKAESKKAMPFVQVLKKQLESGVGEDEVFERKLGFDEVEVLREMGPGLLRTLHKCVAVEMIAIAEGGKEGEVVGIVGQSQVKEGDKVADLAPMAESAVPGQPTFFFENV